MPALAIAVIVVFTVVGAVAPLVVGIELGRRRSIRLAVQKRAALPQARTQKDLL